MKPIVTYALAILLGAATYGVASFGTATPEAEACGYREPPPTVDVSGVYDSNYGTVVLEQKGRRVTGHYDCCGGGTINGYMSGETIRFTWTQPGATGRGVWSVGDKQRLAGTWGYDGSDTTGGTWNLAARPVIAAWRD